MGQAAEERWDGITTVASAVGITILSSVGLYVGELGTTGLLVSISALAGMGGYSIANLVKKQR